MSTGSANSRDGDAFWKALLSDLNLVHADYSIKRNGPLDELDERYLTTSHGDACHGSAERSIVNGSYPSSMMSSRSPSPSALDNPVSAAAKRETLLGASLSSDFGSMRGGMSLRSSSNSLDANHADANERERRRPDLGLDWKKDVDRIGSQALKMLDTSNLLDKPKQALSHTEALIQKLEHQRAHEQPRAPPSTPAAPQVQRGAAAYQMAPAAAYHMAPALNTPAFKIAATAAHEQPNTRAAHEQPNTTQAPPNLKVLCTMDAGGATAHVTWAPLWESWAPVMHGRHVAYEVQMIVKWISGQTWNTIYTVSETRCKVSGLKASHPFAVRVRAISVGPIPASGPWVTEYTEAFEFVTQASHDTQESNAHMPSHHALNDSNVKTEASVNEAMDNQPAAGASSYQPASYLERVMQARQEKVDREASERYLDMQHLANQNISTQVIPSQVIPSCPSYRSMDSIAHIPPGLTQPLHYASQPSTQHQRAAPSVRRITLHDPANPHHGLMQKMQLESKQTAKAYQDFVERDAQTKTVSYASQAPEAAPLIKTLVYSSRPLVSATWFKHPQTHAGSTVANGRPYQGTLARKRLPDEQPTTEPTRDTQMGQATAMHVAGMPYQASASQGATVATGPLARALGVTQYASSSVAESMMVRSTPLPMAMPSAQAPMMQPSMPGASVSVGGSRSVADSSGKQSAFSLASSMGDRRRIIA